MVCILGLFYASDFVENFEVELCDLMDKHVLYKLIRRDFFVLNLFLNIYNDVTLESQQLKYLHIRYFKNGIDFVDINS